MKKPLELDQCQMRLSTEIGVNNPAFSSFDLKALELHSLPQECHISIQIGLNGLSYCIRNDKEILGIESYEQSLSQIEKIFKENNWLSKRYVSSIISITTKKSTLVPSTIFSNEYRKDLLKLNHRKIEELDILTDEISILDSHCVYGISKAEQDIITTHLPSSKVKHFSSRYIPHLLSENKNFDGQKMIVNVTHNQICISVFDHSKFIYHNVFNYKNAHDCIYYVLFTCEQVELNPENIVLEFMGDISKDDEIFTLAYTYVRTIEFSQRKVSVSQNIEKINSHNFYSLIHQHLCE
ncbi:MAG: DUF3822 family protein [Flavobacteriales bacterium]|nr:DUF3822 family protein [Flavobacteriales bacterium]